MTEPIRFDITSEDGLVLAAYRVDPAGEPRAIAQIAHGVGEHSRRYFRVAQALADDGYVVYLHDHRAHGATLRAGDEPGVIGSDGWRLLVADIGRVGDAARAAHPGLPLKLIAHSLGSFAAQQLLLDRSDLYDAVVLSGTAAIDLLEPMMDLDAPMDLSGFNAPFAPARTDFDWLSRDDSEVDKYIADPLCGFGLDAAGTRAAFEGARAIADPERLSAVRSDLPLLMMVGQDDPVNGQGPLVQTLAMRYREAGLTASKLIIWPGARHEIFNETNRDAIVARMIAWLDEH